MDLNPYLQRYAEVHAREWAAAGCHLSQTTDKPFRSVLVVPAYDEPPGKLLSLVALCRRFAVLPVVIANAPLDAPVQARLRTRQMLTQLDQWQHQQQTPMLLCNLLEPGLAPKQGVGLARKIGNDMALFLLQRGVISSPWLYQTDADARLPDNYFTTPLPASGAAIFDFVHHADQPLLQTAADLYQQHMHYYVAGLRHAGSPYAFTSLGSTVAIHAQAYAAVRGFPRRNAGEDFYLLNKLAKIAPVHSVGEVVVTLQARLSSRVPFGTGPALDRICKLLQDHSPAAYCSYHPAVFDVLASVHRQLKRFASDPDNPPSGTTAQLLAQLGWHKVSDQFIQRYSQPQQRHKAIMDWFDGLKHLRCVHLLQQRYPDQPLLQTLASDLPWLNPT